jgi:hypothetical protein
VSVGSTSGPIGGGTAVPKLAALAALWGPRQRGAPAVARWGGWGGEQAGRRAHNWKPPPERPSSHSAHQQHTPASPCSRLLAEQYGWNLNAWRKALERRGDKAYAEGFAVLDADGGAGWDLLCSLIQYDPSRRLSSSAALAHPWFGGAAPLAALSSTVASLGKVASSVASVDDGWLERQVARNGTREAGGFTEAYLTEEGFTQEARKREVRRPADLQRRFCFVASRGAEACSPRSAPGLRGAGARLL